MKSSCEKCGLLKHDYEYNEKCECNYDCECQDEMLIKKKIQNQQKKSTNT